MTRIVAILILALSYHLMPAQTERITLTALNSEFVEYAPSISADGKKMLFQSNRNGDYQLFESFKNDKGEWSTPSLLKGKINDYGDSTDLIGGPSLSYDGNFIYFFASYDGGMGVEDIYFSERESDSWGTPQNIGAPINTKAYEGFPSISSDGNSLYFMRLNKNMESKTNCYTLMVSHKDADGHWQQPYALPDKINQGCEKFPRIMPDNETFVFSSIRENTLEGSFDLYQVRHLGNDQWTDPLWLNYANTANHDYFATVSSVAENIFLNTKGVGDYNLYSYYIPEGLRPKKVINITGVVSDAKSKAPMAGVLKVYDESGEKLMANLTSNHTDGTFTLVLAEGKYMLQVTHNGYYKFEQPLTVTMPKNYGPIQQDVPLSPYAGKAIVQTVNALTGAKLESAISSVITLPDSNAIAFQDRTFDVKFNKTYKVTVAAEGFNESSQQLTISSTELDTHVIELPLLPKKPEVVFQPRDAETNQPIPVNLMITEIGSKKRYYRNKLNQDTTLTLNFKSKYAVMALSKGYLFLKETLDLSEVSSYEKIEHPIALQKIEPGAKLTLEEVFFDTNSSELDKSSYDELAAVYKFLRYNKTLVVEIAAHTDHVGSLNDNQTLSDARAKAVVDFLVSKGADSTRLVAKGYGELEPISSNTHAEGRAMNRRVEFKVLKVK